MAVKDCAQYIDASLESVFNQSFLDMEVVVVLGKSQDMTQAKLQNYGRKVRLILEKKSGVAAARNQAVQAARGRFLAFLDGDDYWLPRKLSLQVDFMEQNPDYGMTFTDAWDLLPDGNFEGPYLAGKKHPVPSGNIFADLIAGNFIPSITVMVRRDLFLEGGGFDEQLLFAEDTELWLRLAKRMKIGFLPEPLSVYRVHQDSRIHLFREHYAARLEIIRKYLCEIRGKPGRSLARCRGIEAGHLRRYGDRLFREDDLISARKVYLSALRCRLMYFHVWSRLVATYLPPSWIQKIRGWH